MTKAIILLVLVFPVFSWSAFDEIEDNMFSTLVLKKPCRDLVPTFVTFCNQKIAASSPDTLRLRWSLRKEKALEVLQNYVKTYLERNQFDSLTLTSTSVTLGEFHRKDFFDEETNDLPLDFFTKITVPSLFKFGFDGDSFDHMSVIQSYLVPEKGQMIFEFNGGFTVCHSSYFDPEVLEEQYFFKRLPMKAVNYLYDRWALSKSGGTGQLLDTAPIKVNPDTLRCDFVLDPLAYNLPFLKNQIFIWIRDPQRGPAGELLADNRAFLENLWTQQVCALTQKLQNLGFYKFSHDTLTPDGLRRIFARKIGPGEPF